MSKGYYNYKSKGRKNKNSNKNKTNNNKVQNNSAKNVESNNTTNKVDTMNSKIQNPTLVVKNSKKNEEKVNVMNTSKMSDNNKTQNTDVVVKDSKKNTSTKKADTKNSSAKDNKKSEKKPSTKTTKNTKTANASKTSKTNVKKSNTKKAEVQPDDILAKSLEIEKELKELEAIETESAKEETIDIENIDIEALDSNKSDDSSSVEEEIKNEEEIVQVEAKEEITQVEEKEETTKEEVKEEDATETKASSNSFDFNKIYLGYYARLFLSLFVFIFYFGLATYMFIVSLKYEPEKVIKYKENSDIDYSICFNKDNPYEQDCYNPTSDISAPDLFISSVIDRIPVSFSYDFLIEDNSNFEFTYSIIADLEIYEETGTKKYIGKKYYESEPKTYRLRDDNHITINEDVVIDYVKYNREANQIKTNYGLNTVSNLKVYLKIDRKDVDGKFNINGSKEVSISIPLSEKAIDMTIEENELESNEEVISEGKYNINKVNLCIAIISLIAALYEFYSLIKLLFTSTPKKTTYDKYVNGILTEYDRLIVETSTYPMITDCDIVKIDKFTELLDVRDNLKLPIMYYVITPHHKCYFYIKNENTVYLNIVKAVDLENDSNEKK